MIDWEAELTRVQHLRDKVETRYEEAKRHFAKVEGDLLDRLQEEFPRYTQKRLAQKVATYWGSNTEMGEAMQMLHKYERMKRRVETRYWSRYRRWNSSQRFKTGG